MMVVLAMTIVQRTFGFLRGILFCRLMDDSVVGQWAMAFDFIIMITPVMLFGMPGSLPRYVETYRQQGHLRSLVKRLLISTAVLGGIFLVAMFVAPDWFGWLIFLDTDSQALTYSVAIGVLATIAFNFVHQLVCSLRQIRVGSLMQFLQSVFFTLFALFWLITGGGIVGVIVSFAIGSVLAMLPGLWTLYQGWDGVPQSDAPFDAPSMWRRLLPYAAALWTMNLLANLFEMSDRYMILHFTAGSEVVGQSAVGQYHSGRIFPVLLLSLATMISGVLMPYLSADWEAGRRCEVVEQMRKFLAAISLLFTAGSAAVLLIAPWLFATLLQNRYSDGLALMPMAFVFYIWASIAIVGQDYLWVAERGKWVGIAITLGLIVNITLNHYLLPIWGLHGAVVATLCSHAIVLSGVWIAMVRCDFHFDSVMLVISLLPATLLLGPITALFFVAIIPATNQRIQSWIGEGLMQIKERWALPKVARVVLPARTLD